MTIWSLSGQPLILASASPIRAALLEAAQIAFDIAPASVDEDAIKQAALQEGFLMMSLSFFWLS